jgi:tetratricopeptide (TPR) repeat protein
MRLSQFSSGFVVLCVWLVVATAATADLPPLFESELRNLRARTAPGDGVPEDCTKREDDPDIQITNCTAHLQRHSQDSAAHNNAVAYVSRGGAYLYKHDNDRAMADCIRAIEIDPKYRDAYHCRGEAYRAKREFDHAIADYDKAIEIDPKYVSSYVGRGAAYLSKGEHERAIAEFNTAIDINPKFADAYSFRGDAYRIKGENDHAIADLNKAIEMDPKLASAYAGRGVAYRNKGEYDRAIADYDKAIEIDPKRDFNYRGRGNAYRGKGEYDRSIADLTRAIELDPNDLRNFADRAQAYEATGEREKAIEDYNRALSLPAHRPDVVSKQTDALNRLAALKSASSIAAPVSTAALPIGTLPAFGRRISLLIGNQGYSDKVGPLKNPRNDVALVEAALKKVGFEVTVLRDADYRSMDLAIKRYVSRVRDAGSDTISFFYYSGHGTANPITHINFLVPIDVADAETEDLWHQSIEAPEIIDKLSAQAPDATHYVVFDACRDELKLRQTGRTLSSTKGFVPIINTSGLLIAYSTAPNRTASDLGIGGGPYAKALAEEITRPGQEAVTMFRNVQLKVKQANGQDPWLSFPTLRPVYFAGEQAPTAASAGKR